MGEQKVGVEKTWKVEYGRSFLKSRCSGCGLKTREWVRHDIIDYFNKNGSTHLIHLHASWHRRCHDERCWHDFCVEQRALRFVDVFGNHIVEVVKALGNMIKTMDVPKFLSSPHSELNGLSPIHIIWEHDEWGFKRVMNIIEGVASGSFV